MEGGEMGEEDGGEGEGHCGGERQDVGWVV